MNILKFLGGTLSMVLVFGFCGWILHLYLSANDRQTIADLHAELIAESQTVSLFELEVVYTAQAIEGEARGHEADWPLILSAIVNRVQDPRWSDSLIGVLLTPRSNGRGCEIDAMCDQVMEDLSSDTGFAALMFAQRALASIHAGDHVSETTAHSWATPSAAKDHAYFESLVQVAEGSGHAYFADKPTRPKMRPGCLQNCAPIESFRPQMRPAQPVLPVVVSGDDDVMASLLLAVK